MNVTGERLLQGVMESDAKAPVGHQPTQRHTVLKNKYVEGPHLKAYYNPH